MLVIFLLLPFSGFQHYLPTPPEPVGMSTIILKVRWGPTRSYKLLNFQTSKTCSEVSEEIKSKYELSDELFRLYSPPTDERGPIWLDPTKKLSFYRQTLLDRVGECYHGGGLC